jgi:hypothetical protein
VKEAQELTGKLGHLAEGANWVFHLLTHLYASITYALSENKRFLADSSPEFQTVIKSLWSGYFFCNVKDQIRHISFAIKRSAKLVHQSRCQYNITKSMCQEIEFFHEKLLPKSGICWESPIVHIIPRMPTFITFGASCFKGARGYLLSLGFWWHLPFPETGGGGDEDTGSNSNGGGNNKQQSTKSSGSNGDRNNNDDSNDNNDKNEGDSGVGGSAVLAVAAGWRQQKRGDGRQRSNMATAVVTAAQRWRRRQRGGNGGGAAAAWHQRRWRRRSGGGGGSLAAGWQAPRWWQRGSGGSSGSVAAVARLVVKGSLAVAGAAWRQRGRGGGSLVAALPWRQQQQRSGVSGSSAVAGSLAAAAAP